MDFYGQHRALVAALAAAAAGPAEACRLALILAIDISSSVDAAEDALQRRGLAAALAAPEVAEAFFASPDPVALAIFEWSGRHNQQTLLDWTMISSEAELLSISGRIGASVRSHNDFPTAVGHAIAHASLLFDRAPNCLFKTLDVAGDGVNNEGYSPIQAYDAFGFEGITVNGLIVNAGDFEGSPELVNFYMNQLRLGPTAFVEVANGFDDYERAMRRKLVRELEVMAISAMDLPGGRG